MELRDYTRHLFHYLPVPTMMNSQTLSVSRSHEPAPLPEHLEIGFWTHLLSAVAIGIAFVLLAVLAGRITFNAEVFPWYALVAIPGGMLVADFLSGMVHWFADTWGSESMPILGKRLLHPFRVHHVNPADFLRRRFADTNGEVAMLTIPLLCAALLIPLTSPLSVTAAVFASSFLGIGLMTNQIHQWAHMRLAPMGIRQLQHLRLILSHEDHEQHHRPPYAQHYCITTGWCNRPLSAIQFFPRLERCITWLTGIQPRQDDQAFHQEVFHGATSSQPNVESSGRDQMYSSAPCMLSETLNIPQGAAEYR